MLKNTTAIFRKHVQKREFLCEHVILGTASLALILSAPSAFAKGHVGGWNHGEAGVNEACRTLVRAKYCGGQPCADGSPAKAQARAARLTCIQNRGTL